eukprot:scaffold3815_cov251-Pinguiococcus_pyrenoidosus.AAC.4
MANGVEAVVRWKGCALKGDALKGDALKGDALQGDAWKDDASSIYPARSSWRRGLLIVRPSV